MLALLFLAGAALVGIGLTRRVLRGMLNSAELLMWGTVAGWMLATLCVYSLANLQGQLNKRLIAWITIGLWVAAAFLLRPALVQLRRNLRAVWQPQLGGLVLVLLLFAPIYWRLFSTQMLPRGQGGLYSGRSAWDLSLHAAVTSSFVYGANFPPIYTSLPPQPLLYPFMPDFHTAVLMAAGLNFHAALLFTALSLAFIITGLLYSLAFRLVHSRGAAVLATILFLFNGGLGFLELLRDWWKSGRSFLSFWNTLEVNYANAWERGLHWTNVIADTFLPQRTSLYGISVGLIIFTLFATVWHRDFKQNGTSENRTDVGPPGSLTLLLVAGFFAGVLPLFHPHTYVAVGLVSAFLFAMRPRRIWLAFWIPALLVAAPQLWLFAHHAAGTGVPRLQPGWMRDVSQNFPFYLLRNFGVPLLIIIPAWLQSPRVWRRFYFAFVLLFVFCFVVMVSPNIYDNNKLMHYWYMLTCIIMAAWLVKIATNHWRRLAAFVLVISCIASGLAALQSENHSVRLVFTDEEIAAADFVRNHTDPSTLFLSAPIFNQPVMCLAGRPIVRGPTSWLWSHGYEFREREADVRRIYAGAPDAVELLGYYDVDYIYLSDAERRELKASAEFFDSNFPIVYRSTSITIYDARPRSEREPEARNRKQRDLKAPPPRELASRLGKDPYFLLIEFPETSFFVYRLVKASSGRLPRLEEFTVGMRVVGHDLFVGARGWEQKLESNTQALLSQWTTSEEFRRAYEGKTNAEFVHELFRNAGLNSNGEEPQELVKRLDAGTETRASALRRVVENKEFYWREYNTAFVLTHFFGYLRRNPDDPPDRSLGGLYFWRAILDRTHDYRSISRAFLESDEYKSGNPK